MPILECQNITKAFGGVIALANVSLNVNKGEILGVIGPNGAGKTTLFNIITGIYRLDTGAIYFRGQSIVGRKPHQISRNGVARTFQSVKTFLDQTVFENLLVGATFSRKYTNAKIAEDRALQLLSLLNLGPKRNILTRQLTIQDRKYVEIGRALSSEPELLLLDEPMAGLTPAEIKNLADIIQKINRDGITIILVEHVMKALMNLSTRVTVLHHGEKIAEGPPQDIARDRRVIQVYLGERYAAA